MRTLATEGSSQALRLGPDQPPNIHQGRVVDEGTEGVALIGFVVVNSSSTSVKLRRDSGGAPTR